MRSPIILILALATSTLAANAQSPVDTLQDVRPFSEHALDLLVAREPGVEVISSLGAPGTTPTIQVRGIGVLPGIWRRCGKRVGTYANGTQHPKRYAWFSSNLGLSFGVKF